jgi:hypothetical protein
VLEAMGTGEEAGRKERGGADAEKPEQPAEL